MTLREKKLHSKSKPNFNGAFLLAFLSATISFVSSATARAECPPLPTVEELAQDGMPGSVPFSTVQDARAGLSDADARFGASENFSQAVHCMFRSLRLRPLSHPGFFNLLGIQNFPERLRAPYGRGLGRYAADLMEDGRPDDARDVAFALLSMPAALEGFTSEMAEAGHRSLNSRGAVETARRAYLIERYERLVQVTDQAVEHFLEEDPTTEPQIMAAAIEKDRDRALNLLRNGIRLVWIAERDDPAPGVEIVGGQPMQIITKTAVSQYDVARARLEERAVREQQRITVRCALDRAAELPPMNRIVQLSARLLEISGSTYTFACE